MSNDPIERIADEHLREIYYDVMVQLERGTGTRPVLWVLTEARKKAAAAIVQMTLIDPTRIEDLRTCQATIRVYDEMVLLFRDLMKRGKDADRTIHEQEREEIGDLVHDLSPEEQRMAGLEPQGTDL